MTPIYETILTGAKMTQFKNVAPDIHTGTILSIFRRPDNNFDPLAMSVHFGDSITSPQVGWIPNKSEADQATKRILNLLDAGNYQLIGRVLSIDVGTYYLRMEVIIDDAASGIEDEEEEIPLSNDEMDLSEGGDPD